MYTLLEPVWIPFAFRTAQSFIAQIKKGAGNIPQ